jgi:hypothetical protein
MADEHLQKNEATLSVRLEKDTTKTPTRAAEKLWRELSQPEVDHFYPIISQRAERYAERAFLAQWDLAKYLFTANTGAAAGLFLLSKSAPDHRYLIAFFLFCGGTFWVGLAYFIFANWMHGVAEGWAQDFNSRGLSVKEADARNAKRHKSPWFAAPRWCLALSFTFLIAGGVLAACVFWPQSPKP